MELKHDDIASAQALDDLLVFADDALAGDGRDDLEIAVRAGLPHPGNHGFVHIERHALFQTPANDGQRLLGAAREAVERQDEDAHHEDREPAEPAGAPRSGTRLKTRAKRGANRVGLGDVGLNRRGHDGADLQGLHRAGVRVSPGLTPARRGHVIRRDFDDQGRMRHDVEPAVQAADETNLKEAVFEARRIRREAIQGMSPC